MQGWFVASLEATLCVASGVATNVTDRAQSRATKGARNVD